MLFVVLSLILLFSFYLGRRQALIFLHQPAGTSIHSLPQYHGMYLVLWCSIPAFAALCVWTVGRQLIIRPMVLSEVQEEAMKQHPAELVFEQIKAAAGSSGLQPQAALLPAVKRYQRLEMLSTGAGWLLVLLSAIAGLIVGRKRLAPELKARIFVEHAFRALLFVCSCIAVLTTIGIICSLLFESIQFFARVPVTEFLFGLKWSPQIAMRSDQVAAAGAFGALPLFAGTLLISFVAMCVAAPVGLLAAIYLAEYASKRVRQVAKPLLEILAGIPTVVYGFFAVLVVAPWVRELGMRLGMDVSSESALAAGVVMGTMIIPFVSSLSDDVLTAVPQALRDGSLAIGATHAETVQKVVLPAALPGIVGSLLLAVSRAIGETMIVVMAAGMAANLTLNPFENVTTVTVQIVNMLVGDQEFDSPKTLAAFALGLTLFCLTLILNIIALRVVKRYREAYE